MNRILLGLRAALLCGGLVLLVGIATLTVYPVALDTLPAGFRTPILALEFIPSMAAAQALFAGDQALVERMQLGHWLDMLFLLCYGAFLALPNGVMWLRYRHWTSLVGMSAAVVASIADAVENGQLLQLGAAVLDQGPEPDFALLRRCVEIKFLAIVLAMLFLGRSLFRFGLAGKLFALVSLILVPVTLLGLNGSILMIEVMTLLIAAGWVILLVWLVQMRHGLPAASASG